MIWMMTNQEGHWEKSTCILMFISSTSKVKMAKKKVAHTVVLFYCILINHVACNKGQTKYQTTNLILFIIIP
jgi:hypothetical protein